MDVWRPASLRAGVGAGRRARCAASAARRSIGRMVGAAAARSTLGDLGSAIGAGTVAGRGPPRRRPRVSGGGGCDWSRHRRRLNTLGRRLGLHGHPRPPPGASATRARLGAGGPRRGAGRSVCGWSQHHCRLNRLHGTSRGAAAWGTGWEGDVEVVQPTPKSKRVVLVGYVPRFFVASTRWRGARKAPLVVMTGLISLAEGATGTGTVANPLLGSVVRGWAALDTARPGVSRSSIPLPNPKGSSSSEKGSPWPSNAASHRSAGSAGTGGPGRGGAEDPRSGFGSILPSSASVYFARRSGSCSVRWRWS